MEKRRMANPVVLYGESGNGKTHLVEIMKERLLEREEQVKVLKADDFTAQLVNSIKNSAFSRMDFCNQFLQYNVLILEDVQCLACKTYSQRKRFERRRQFI